MKRLIVVLMGVVFAGLAVSAQAANVDFNPGEVSLKVEPGNSAVASLVANAYSSRPHEIHLDVGTYVRGNMDRSWLTPANVILKAERGNFSSAGLRVGVKVPAGTLSGTYTAHISPRPLPKSSEGVSSRGVTITVDVPSQEKCVGLPSLENVKVGPENIWAPKNREVEIDISGTVIVAPGCEISGTFTMESNDDPVNGDLVIDGDGNFDQKIKVSVSKDGKARDGKTYNGVLTVVDVEGNSVSQGFFVKVDHDFRGGKKKGLNKK